MEPHTLVDGKYFVEARTRTGEWESTYLVWHDDWGQYITAKVSLYPPGHPSHRCLAREARQWVDLGIHPNLLAAHFFREIGNRLWLFLESPETVPFDSRDPADSLGIAIEVANGLAYLQSEKIVCGNFRKESVALCRDGRVRIRGIRWDHWSGLEMVVRGLRSPTYPQIDSELAARLAEEGNARLAYLPPEYFRAPEVSTTAAFDMYAFGVFLRELWDGRPPLFYPEADLDNLFFLYGSGHRKREGSPFEGGSMPHGLCPLAAACLEEDPERRPQEFSEIVRTLQGIYLEATGKPYVLEELDENNLLAMSLTNRALGQIDSGEWNEAEKMLGEVSHLDNRRVGAALNLNLLKLRCREISFFEFSGRMDLYKNLSLQKPSLLQGEASLEYGSLVPETLEKLKPLEEDPEMALVFAAFYERLMHYSCAKDILSAFLEKAGGNQEIWYRLGSVCLELKLYDRAREAWEKGLERELPLWDLLASYSLLLARQGEWNLARKFMERGRPLPNHQLHLRAVQTWSHVQTMQVDPVSAVTQVSFSEKNDYVCGWTEDGNCRIWKWPVRSEVEGIVLAPDMERLRRTKLPGELTAVSVASRSRIAATVHGRESFLRVWELPQIEPRMTLQGHAAAVTSVALSADGRTAVSGSLDKTVKVWDLESGECRATLRGHTDCVHCVALSEDGSVAVSAGWDKTLRVWSLSDFTCRTVLPGEPGEISALSISGNGRWAISADSSPLVRIWDLELSRELARLQSHRMKIHALHISSDGRWALSGSEGGKVCVYEDVAQRLCPCLSKAHYQPETLPSAVPLQKRQELFLLESGILSSLRDNKFVSLKDSQNMRKRADLPFSYQLMQALSASVSRQGLRPGKLCAHYPINTFVHDVNANAFEVASSDSLFVMAEDGNFFRWNWQNGRTDNFWVRENLGMKGFAYSPVNSCFCFAGRDKGMYLWHADSFTWEVLEAYPAHLSAIRIDPTGNLAVAGDMDGMIQIWNLPRGRLLDHWQAHSGAITDIVLTDDGGVATASLDGTVACWDLEKKSLRVQGQKRGAPILSLAVFRNDQDYMISGSIDGVLRQWSMSNGLPCSTIKAHDAPITSLDLGMQGSLALLGTQDGKLKLFDPAKRQCLASIQAHDAPVIEAKLSQDGTLIHSSAQDHTVKVFLLDWYWEEM